MKQGLTDEGKYWIEYTSCPRAVGNMREEINIACQRLANTRKTMISLSSGLDSQIILHSFAEQGLDYKCAFLHHPGINDFEFENIKILEKKYGFKAIVVTIDPFEVKDQIVALSESTKIPPQHYLTSLFFDQLDEEYQILEGIESPDAYLRDGRWKLLESYDSIDTVPTWFHSTRKNPTVYIDDRNENQEVVISMLTDEIACAYRYSFNYIKGNGLFEASTKEELPWLLFGWINYIKPIQLGKYWKDELEYFPKFASQKKIDYIFKPTVNHNYFARFISIDLEEHLELMCDWGSGRTKKYIQAEGK